MLDGVAVEVIEDGFELIAEPVPARILRAGQADKDERFGVLDVFQTVVSPDEPETLIVSLLEVAAVAVDLGAHPAGGEVIGVERDGGVSGFLRLVPPAAQEEQFRPACEQVCVLGAVLESVIDGFEGLVILAAALLHAADTDGDARPKLGIGGELLILIERLIIVAAQPALPGGFQRGLSRSRRRAAEDEKAGAEVSCHAAAL